MNVLITGAPGQDAYYLAQYHLGLGNKVACTYRYTSTEKSRRFLDWDCSKQIEFIQADISDPIAISSLVSRGWDHIYNLAAMSHVGESFRNPVMTAHIDYLSVLYFTEAIRTLSPFTRFYQASTSEMFGSNYTVLDSGECVQNESTPFHPRSPYGVAKCAAHHQVQLYREAYDLFMCSGILFNHESPHRGEHFFTRKCTKYIGQLSRFLQLGESQLEDHGDWISIRGQNLPKLRLGNLDSIRDFSHAKDLVRGMYILMTQEQPEDCVFCSGHGVSMRTFLDKAFEIAGIEDPERFYVIDPELYRPAEVDYLQGSSRRARELGWEPEYSLEDLITEMVNHDIRGARR